MGTHKSQIFCLMLLMVGMRLQGQRHTQMGLGNYGAVNSYYINPSLNAYSAYNWQIHLAGAWTNVNNNYLSLRTPYSLYRLPNNVPLMYQTESGNPRFDKQWLNERLNGRDKHVAVSTDIYGPAFNFKHKTWHFGLMTEGSAAVRIVNLPEALAHAVFKELDSAQGAFNLFQANGNNVIGSFNVTGNSRAAIGINLAKSFQLDWNRQVLAGITVKKVVGFQGFQMTSSGISAQQINQDSVLISPTQIQVMEYGSNRGNGMGIDIGATYIFHKKDFKRHGAYAKQHTRYFAKIGASIMDIGSVKYTDATTRTLTLQQATGISLSQSYPGTTNYQAALDSFMRTFGTYTSTNGNTAIGLPTRLVLSGDLQLRKHVFVSTIVSQSLRSRVSRHARYQSFLMVSPRLEHRFFEFSLPLMLEYDYRSLRMGASFRVGPLYFGTNSLMSFISTRRINDADIFAGIVLSNLSEFSFRKQAKNKSKRSKGNSCFAF